MRKTRKKTFLCVSPHPDDVELGAGGFIARCVDKGHALYIVDLTTGEPTPRGTEEKRLRESRKASKILGIRGRINLRLPNRFLFDTKDARLLLAEQIRVYRPDSILCPYFEDAHPDHCAAARLTESARFYAKYTKINLSGRPYYCRYLWYYFSVHLRSIPPVSFLLDISEQFQRKMRAVRAYKSQFIDNETNRPVLDYIESQARYFGHIARTRYAEGFYTREKIALGDASSLLQRFALHEDTYPCLRVHEEKITEGPSR